MPSLLDEAIQVGKKMEGAEQRLAHLKADIALMEDVLKARQQELSTMERHATERIHAEQTTWDTTRREQAAALQQREDDVVAHEQALRTFPEQAKALEAREASVIKRATEVEAQWRAAKQAELDWMERNKELDAKAEAINQLPR